MARDWLSALSETKSVIARTGGLKLARFPRGLWGLAPEPARLSAGAQLWLGWGGGAGTLDAGDAGTCRAGLLGGRTGPKSARGEA